MPTGPGYDSLGPPRAKGDAMQSVEDQVTIITGAAAGMGLGMVRAFAGAGMRVVASDVRQDALDGAVADLRKAGHEVTGVVADVSRLADVEALAQATLDTYGAVHVLCNNAGVGLFSPRSRRRRSTTGSGSSASTSGARSTASRCSCPLIEREDEGHINSTSSLAGLLAAGTAGPYNVAKHHVIALMATLDRELRSAKSSAAHVGAVPGPGQHPGSAATASTAAGPGGVRPPVAPREGDKVADKLVKRPGQTA